MYLYVCAPLLQTLAAMPYKFQSTKVSPPILSGLHGRNGWENLIPGRTWPGLMASANRSLGNLTRDNLVPGCE